MKPMTLAQSRAFDRGNYCNAYETTDWETAYADNCDSLQGDGVAQAFLCGFFSSYELDEVGDEMVREELAVARAMFGED